MGYKRSYSEKEHEYKDPFIDSIMHDHENSLLNRFQDKLRKENEEIDKILEEAWEQKDKEDIQKAKKLKREIRQAMRDITNLKLNTSQSIKKRSLKKRKSSRTNKKRSVVRGSRKSKK
jgi:DNA-binding ferritin-like protein (Dps family)